MAQKEKSKTGRISKNRRPSKKSYHHGDLKKALLVSSVELLKIHGPQAFSLRELALRVGVSSAAPYRHFKTKEKVFSSLAVEGFALLTEGFSQAIESHLLEPLEQLHAVGVSYYQFAVKYPQHLQMMFGNIITQSEIAKDADFGAAAGKAFGLLVQVVKNCQAVKSLDAKEDARMLAILIWSSIHGFAALDMAGTLQGASGLNYNREQAVVRISKAISTGLNIKV